MIGSVDSFLQNLKLPEIVAERCVHSQIANASCQACITVCHADALQLNDEELSIDLELCDGCGLCAAACPESAIEHEHNPLSIRWRDEQLSLVACEKISASDDNQSDSIISCIHALSMHDLLKLYTSGHQRLLVSTAQCQDCNRGSIEQLDKHLHTLNALLTLRGSPRFERINITGEQWLNIIRSADHTNTGQSLSRRHFLRRAASEISEYGLRKFELAEEEESAPLPLANLLPEALTDEAFPFVPEINTERCTACSTCIKLCPHDALVLEQDDHSATYIIDAKNCTDCDICIDVCEEDAIIIMRNTNATQKSLTLSEFKCQTCQIDFLTLDNKPSSLCTICQQKKYHTELFQVLD